MISLWKDSCLLPHFDALCENAETDVLIIGGGISGILCAYMLKQEGIDYMLVESKRISMGVTGNTTAKITSQHGLIYNYLIKKFGNNTAKLYHSANEEAIRDYRAICKNFDCEFKNAESFIYSRKDSFALKSELEALKTIGIAAEYKESCELPFSITGAIGFKNQAHFNPLKFLSHIAHGLNIFENTHIVKVKDNTAFTKEHSIKAKRIIVTTHFPFINSHGFYFLKMYQNRSYVILAKTNHNINGMYLDECEQGLSFRPYNDNYLLIGGGSHRTGCQNDAWQPAENFINKYYPDTEIKYRWATQDCMTLDKMPYIGRYSKLSKNLYVATGFNKWGMTSSMIAAKLLCDMMVGRKNKYESIFSPSRSIIHPQLALNGIEAFRGWLSISKKRCPHLGCALSYNKSEHTWDCSCHGSRFDKEGNLLDNPANRGLDREN